MRRAATLACRLASRFSPSSSCSALRFTAINNFMLGKSLVTDSLAHRASWAETVSPLTRAFSTGVDTEKELDAINELFKFAREEIGYALEESETVYFNLSVGTAQEAVKDCLERWEALLVALDAEQRGRVMRSMGLKMAQLKAELDALNNIHLND